jgi:hypothetical protein
MDWVQLWQIASAPDNVPILIMLGLVGFYSLYSLKHARANDRLAAELEADPVMQKTHHRKRFPFQKGWAERVHVWPYLLKIEFLAAIIVTALSHRVVDRARRPAGRAGQPLADHEPVEGAMVLPRLAGNPGLLRPVDRGRGAAGDHRRRANAHSLRRRQPAGQRLLHVQAAQVRDLHLHVRIS